MRLNKWQYVLIVVYFLSQILAAQQNQLTVLYTNTSSGIGYESATNEKRRVFAGLNLPLEGKISLSAGAWANILINNQKLKLEGPRVIDLVELAKSYKKRRPSSFMRRFLTFLGNSVSQTDDAQKLEKYHRQYLTEARAGISGFGDKEYLLSGPVYLSEILSEAQVKFNWTPVKGATVYHFLIETRDDPQIILKANTQANQLTLMLNELQLDSETVYQWKVIAQLTKDSTLQSRPLFFSYDPALVDQTVAELKADDDFQDLEAFEKPLYLMNALEKEGFYQKAYHHYSDLLEVEPENVLYKKLFAAFLVRMNAVEAAKDQIKTTGAAVN